jgi:hypothetical protein
MASVMFIVIGCWVVFDLVVVGLIKTPVMINILKAKSTSGLSATAACTETLAYANFVAFDIFSGRPIAIHAAILVQSVIVTMLMWHYSTPPTSKVERGIALLAAIAYIFLVVILLPTTYHYLLLPTTYHYLLEQSAMLMLLYSKCSQIWVTQSCRHKGPQSFVSTFWNVCPGMVWILDNGVFSDPRETLKTALNLIMLLQLFYYDKNTMRLKVAASKKY